MTYTCPVCGFDRLPEPPDQWEIGPCCGTEFENDDEYASHSELRRDWIARGAGWWSKNVSPPSGWSAREQIGRSGHAEDGSGIQQPVKA